MKINYSFRHMDSSERAKAHTSSKLERLARLEDREMVIDVVFSQEKLNINAEFRVVSDHGIVVISETRQDLFEAIDVGVDKLDQVISREKGKRKNHKGQPGLSSQEIV